MRIEPLTASWRTAWHAMRRDLWPDADDPADLPGPDQAHAVWLAIDGNGAAIGFVEAALRHDHVNGCDTSPVAFLEGLYVAPAARRRGAARALVAAVAAWSRARGVAELASDAPLDNDASHALHRALGFAETERVVYFRRPLAR